VPQPMSVENFIAANDSRDGEAFIEVAQLIAGESPPVWLASHLLRWSACVMLDGAVQSKQLGKAEARVRLQNLGRAAESIERELHDPAIETHLLAAEFGPMPNNAAIDTALKEIRRRADAASSRLDLLGTGSDARLEDLSDGAKLVARELQDPELSEFLKAEQIGPLQTNVELGTLLKQIGRQANAALSSPHLATSAGKTKAGRSRAFPPKASSPRSFCAAVILEAWAHFHNGEYPPPSNPELAAAAERYWYLCGGITKKGGWGATRLTAWRPYFEEASEPSLADIRKELRRHVIESSFHNY
jgi:hypothetical protein